MQLLQESYGGRGTGAVALAFSLEGWYGDGFNLYQYLGSNPLLRRDPMGLSYDPFDMVDDYLAETAGDRAAFLSQLGRDAHAAATTAALIASWLPIPGISQLGDLGLYALGEQSGGATAAALALGLVPGGKLAGKLGGLIGKIGASAWRTAKRYAIEGASQVLSRASGTVTDLVGSLARRARSFVDRKPRAVACGCFTAATLVWTPAGAVPIGDLEQGAEVFAAPEDGVPSDLAGAEVGAKIIIGEASLVLLTVERSDGSVETIHTTDEHPFHGADTGEWTRADALAPGDHLTSIRGEAEVIAVAYLPRRVPVYNLSIPGSPTYFVGERGLWVHNCGGQLRLPGPIRPKDTARLVLINAQTGAIHVAKKSENLHSDIYRRVGGAPGDFVGGIVRFDGSGRVGSGELFSGTLPGTAETAAWADGWLKDIIGK